MYEYTEAPGTSVHYPCAYVSCQDTPALARTLCLAAPQVACLPVAHTGWSMRLLRIQTCEHCVAQVLIRGSHLRTDALHDKRTILVALSRRSWALHMDSDYLYVCQQISVCIHVTMCKLALQGRRSLSVCNVCSEMCCPRHAACVLVQGACYGNPNPYICLCV
jgi:hypothetical protein